MIINTALHSQRTEMEEKQMEKIRKYRKISFIRESIAILAVIAIMPERVSSICTNQFPKVIGGLLDSTSFTDLDYFAATDNILVVGSTWDTTILSGSTVAGSKYPIVALYQGLQLLWQ